jgi:molybdopterin-guanine dinucleotide biosynthesis protein A
MDGRAARSADVSLIRAGIILAGGSGLRLGPDKPKALRMFGGTTLLERALQLLSVRVERVFVAVPHSFPLVPDRARYERIDDLSNGEGPLAGLVPALEHAAIARADIAWVIPTDMPLLGPAHLDALAYALDPPDGPYLHLSVVPPAAVVPRTIKGIDPLVGAYRPAYAAPILRSAWNRGERAPARALLDLGGRIRYLDVEKEGVWPGGIESLSGVNTPEEWEHVLARAKELERRTLES